ncbi:hypothetical protein GGI21_004035 [Coemansia aciculifera]|uniref:Uncharacterized protein n=1 Tax=Coemansia aciculifera TaxID=417176 RepID=A0ACC1MAH6_9FUNG|nr:hypothetical protein IWW38_000631 [Coemansia aciculifera]KAJ2906450.1 hypothetical protein GGI21_004035 [Coemansia aciculifera]
MGQPGSKAVRRTTTAVGSGSGLRLPRTPQGATTAAPKTREEILHESSSEASEEDSKDSQLEANLKHFLSPRQHTTTMAGMAPAADNANVQALRQRQARGDLMRVESQLITKMLHELKQGAAVERVADDYKLDVGTVRSLQAFLCPVS